MKASPSGTGVKRIIPNRKIARLKIAQRLRCSADARLECGEITADEHMAYIIKLATWAAHPKAIAAA